MPEKAPDCLFCKIVAGEVSAAVIRESESTVAFRDINPQAPVHVLVIPKEHYADAGELASAGDALAGELLREAHGVAADEGVADAGYRLVFNTGPGGGQLVPHAHCHVLGGRQMNWPPG